MRIRTLTIVLAPLLFAASMQAQTPTWSNLWSFPMSGNEQPTEAALDAAGNIYVTTYLLDFTADDPANMVRQFLTCSSPDGTMRWTRSILTGALSRRAAMGVDPAGNVYVAASFYGNTAYIDAGGHLDTLNATSDKNIMFARYNAAGRLLWQKTLSGSDSIHVATMAATSGGVWIGGDFTGTVDFGGTHLASAGRGDVYLAMADSNGTFLEAVRGGGSATEECEKIAADRNGDIVMLGQFRGTATFGDRSITATGGTNFFLVRYHADGTTAWAHADGGPSFSPAQPFIPMPLLLKLDRDGNIYLAISYLDSITIGRDVMQSVSEADALVVKYRADGTEIWTTQYGGDFLQLIEGLAIDTDGSIFVSGYSQLLPQGTFFLTKLSPAGSEVWQTTNAAVGGLSSADGGPVSIDSAHTVIVAGHFSGALRLGSRTVTSFGSSDTAIVGDDIFIAKIASTSGVGLAADHGGAGSPFTIAEHDHQLLLLPAAQAPTVTDAAIYSLLGECVSRPVNTLEHGSPIRFNVEDLAHGNYLIVLRTGEGAMGYRVVIGR
ncbi:MAG TPA: hypothetical protein VHI13_02575 [Candidatus Kapabacteria bacterium]|nr:hypothetical protein [Candidatus Kapabacteria bacterium]